MADISKININDSSEYNIKDTTARDGLTDRPTSFVGTRSEWNALPVATQVKYSLVNLIGEGVYKNNGTGLDNIADVGGETYTEIDYEDWLELTPEEQETGKWDVKGVPGADGTISIDLMTKLWENPNPSANFAAQNITLASDDYDYLLVLAYSSASNNHILPCTVIKKGKNGSLLHNGNSGTAVVVRYRNIDYSSDMVLSISDANVFTNGSSSWTIGNSFIIPYQIYGIKTSKTVEIKAIAPTVSTLASKCMMSDGETSVEEALDDVAGNHALSDAYSSLTKETEFECPSDGYLLINYNANCLVGLRTKDAAGTNIYIMRQNLTASGSSVLPLFVRKGMVIIWLNESTNTSITYRAIVPR